MPRTEKVTKETKRTGQLPVKGYKKKTGEGTGTYGGVRVVKKNKKKKAKKPSRVTSRTPWARVEKVGDRRSSTLTQHPALQKGDRKRVEVKGTRSTGAKTS